MHEEQNNAPVKTVQSNRQEANFPNLEEKENLKQFYLTQSRRLCPTVSVDRSESKLTSHRVSKDFRRMGEMVELPDISFLLSWFCQSDVAGLSTSIT